MEGRKADCVAEYSDITEQRNFICVRRETREMSREKLRRINGLEDDGQSWAATHSRTARRSRSRRQWRSRL